MKHAHHRVRGIIEDPAAAHGQLRLMRLNTPERSALGTVPVCSGRACPVEIPQGGAVRCVNSTRTRVASAGPANQTGLAEPTHHHQLFTTLRGQKSSAGKFPPTASGVFPRLNLRLSHLGFTLQAHRRPADRGRREGTAVRYCMWGGGIRYAVGPVKDTFRLRAAPVQSSKPFSPSSRPSSTVAARATLVSLQLIP